MSVDDRDDMVAARGVTIAIVCAEGVATISLPCAPRRMSIETVEELMDVVTMIQQELGTQFSFKSSREKPLYKGMVGPGPFLPPAMR